MKKNNLSTIFHYDAKGNYARINHSIQPFEVVRGQSVKRVEAIAAAYVRKFYKVGSIISKKARISDIHKARVGKKNITNLFIDDVKKIKNITVVGFQHYQSGIRVLDSGIKVLINKDGNVVESQSTFNYDALKIKVSSSDLSNSGAKFSNDTIYKILNLEENKKRFTVIQKDLSKENQNLIQKALEDDILIDIVKQEQVIYQFDPEKRQKKHKEGKSDRSLAERALDLNLPKVSNSIKANALRTTNIVFFSTKIKKLNINWKALIDLETGSVLKLEPMVHFNGTGLVFEFDPLTSTGNTSILPSSPVNVLNSVRTPKSLASLTPPSLSGEYVVIQDICPIGSIPPTSGSGKFDYNANTDDFNAVNAYYHCDAVFRMVEEMGFDMNTYFDGTTFPVPVDHRGSFACVNAAAWATGSGDGLNFFTYGLVEAGQPVGIATDIRVVLHEFGHAVLFDHVSSGSFGFAHSIGDSLAAVYSDPNSKASDRFLTFPWISAIPRRHDRDVTAGWAWGGTQDDGSYQSEQILSTSHFRAYLAMGGDHKDICEREWASRYLMYLMIHGVGVLTPTTNPNNPESWSETLQLCDTSTEVFEAHPGGAVHKVIRWAFEKQGAYQNSTTPLPITNPGLPPVVDVYINDGRDGEYSFTDDWCQTKDIWNRHCKDGHPAHQVPMPGIKNYAYVIVKNRGTKPSEGGYINAYHKRDNACCDCCDDCAEMLWPNDFIEMNTERLYYRSIRPDDYAIVGPFEWIPENGDCMMMVVEDYWDRSNITHISKGQKITTQRLIPLDNNIAMRCICKNCNPDYSKLKSPCDSHTIIG